MKKKLLSLLLCLSFVLALVPTAMAVDTDTDPLKPADLYYTLGGESTSGEKPDITLSKTAVANDDGTYTVTLSAEAVETVTTKPTEVVFLLDTSGSMKYCADGRGGWCDHSDWVLGVWCDRVKAGHTNSRLTEAKSAIKTVVANLSKNDDTTIKYVQFGNSSAKVVDSYDTISEGNGDTPLSKGTETALKQFTDGDHNKVLIIVADGESDDGYASQKIKEFKDKGGIVYTVGFTFSSKNFTALASKGCSYDAGNADALKVAIDEITTKVAGLISDTMGDDVELIPGSITAAGDGYTENNSEFWTSDDNRTLFWTSKEGLSNKITLTYKVKITDAAKAAAKENGADIPLNKNATLNYVQDGLALQLPFPVPVAHLDREFTLTYESNGGTEYAPEPYTEGTVVPMSKIPTKKDFTFLGWYADAALTTLVTRVTMDSDKTVYAGWKADETPELEKGDHSAYIIGYPDGTVRPEQRITRAEVATIFFRLLTDDAREENWSSTNNYNDVPEKQWYNNAVSTLSNMGIIKGYPDGSFKPNAPITRAEFAAIATRFSKSTADEDASFTDVSKSFWASKEIAKAEKLGWIKGDGDGKFRPNDNIKRYEVMIMVNRVLERAVDKEGICEDVIKWSDNPEGKWYYYDVQEATNSHEFARTDRPVKGQSFCYEEWIKLKENRDWSKLESTWKAMYE